MTFKVGIDGSESRKTDQADLGLCERVLIGLSYLLVTVTFPLSWIFCIKVVNEFERGVLFRLGHVDSRSPRGPGLIVLLPCVDNLVVVDLRVKTYDIPAQEVLTKDSVSVFVNAIVNYYVSDPTLYVLNAQNALHTTNLLAQTALRNVLGTKDLCSILREKDEIASLIREHLDGPTAFWGMRITQLEIKDVVLPISLQRAMAAEAEAEREAKAKIISANGEFQASKSLREAAIIMSQSPFALQLRYLQTLCTISAEKNSTIIFPLPIELLPKLK